MDEPSDDQVAELAGALEKLARRFKLTDAVQGGRPMAEIDKHILLHVAEHPGCGPSNVARSFGVPLTTVSSATDRLAKRGLLQRLRPSTDRRAVELELTAPGPSQAEAQRMLGIFDVGTILNPRTAANQLRGGMIMGLGMALSEELLFDERSGRIMNPSLADYHIPAHLDVPPIDVAWTGIPDPRSPLGARGIGEIAITGVAAAIANALFNATGKRRRDLPLTLDKLLA